MYPSSPLPPPALRDKITLQTQDNKHIPASRATLSSSSPYFRSLLSLLPFTPTPTISLTLHSTTLREILLHISTGASPICATTPLDADAPAHVSDLVRLAVAAEYVAIPSLQKLAGAALTRLSQALPSTACAVLSAEASAPTALSHIDLLAVHESVAESPRVALGVPDVAREEVPHGPPLAAPLLQLRSDELREVLSLLNREGDAAYALQVLFCWATSGLLLTAGKPSGVGPQRWADAVRIARGLCLGQMSDGFLKKLVTPSGLIDADEIRDVLRRRVSRASHSALWHPRVNDRRASVESVASSRYYGGCRACSCSEHSDAKKEEEEYRESQDSDYEEQNEYDDSEKTQATEDNNSCDSEECRISEVCTEIEQHHNEIEEGKRHEMEQQIRAMCQGGDSDEETDWMFIEGVQRGEPDLSDGSLPDMQLKRDPLEGLPLEFEGSLPRADYEAQELESNLVSPAKSCGSGDCASAPGGSEENHGASGVGSVAGQRRQKLQLTGRMLDVKRFTAKLDVVRARARSEDFRFCSIEAVAGSPEKRPLLSEFDQEDSMGGGESSDHQSDCGDEGNDEANALGRESNKSDFEGENSPAESSSPSSEGLEKAMSKNRCCDGEVDRDSAAVGCPERDTDGFGKAHDGGGNVCGAKAGARVDYSEFHDLIEGNEDEDDFQEEWEADEGLSDG